MSWQLLFHPCEDRERSIPSPNGQWLATKINAVCSTFLSPSAGVAVAVGDRRRWLAPTTTVFYASADRAIEMHWRKDKQLVVIVGEGTEPILTLRQAGDVRIIYHPKNDPAVSRLGFRQWAKKYAEPYYQSPYWP